MNLNKLYTVFCALLCDQQIGSQFIAIPISVHFLILLQTPEKSRHQSFTATDSFISQSIQVLWESYQNAKFDIHKHTQKIITRFVIAQIWLHDYHELIITCCQRWLELSQIFRSAYTPLITDIHWVCFCHCPSRQHTNWKEIHKQGSLWKNCPSKKQRILCDWVSGISVHGL